MTRAIFLLAHLHKGGMQRAVSNITLAMPRDIETLVAYFGTENPGYPFGGQTLNMALPGEMRCSAAKRLTRIAQRIRAVRRLVAQWNPDAVVSFGEGAAVYNLLSGARRRILSVRVSLNESLKDCGRRYRYAYNVLLRHAYHRADLIVANSRQLSEEVRARCRVGQQRLRVVSNLFDVARIEELSKEDLPREYESVFRHPVVLNVGSLTHQKGQRHLIAAFAQVHAQHPHAHLVLLGRGKDEERLRRQCDGLGLREQVYFAGFQSNPYAFMRRCRLFVLSSLYEGLPNALIEAMICGAPVVSTDCPTGPREILAPQSRLDLAAVDFEEAPFGTLTPVCRASTREAERARERVLASAISRHLDAPEWSSGVARLSRKRADDFAVERIVGEWVDVIRGESRN